MSVCVVASARHVLWRGGSGMGCYDLTRRVAVQPAHKIGTVGTAFLRMWLSLVVRVMHMSGRSILHTHASLSSLPHTED